MTDMPNESKLMAIGTISVAEAAFRLGVSERTIRRRCESGKLKASLETLPTGVEWRIDSDAVRTGADTLAAPKSDSAVIGADTQPHIDVESQTNPVRPSAANPSDSAVTGADSADTGADSADTGADSADTPDFQTKYIERLESEVEFLRIQILEKDEQIRRAQDEARLAQQISAGVLQLHANRMLPMAAPENAEVRPSVVEDEFQPKPPARKGEALALIRRGIWGIFKR